MRFTTRSANGVNNNPSHPSHWEYNLHCNAYTDLIQATKQKSWLEWLEATDVSSIWSVNDWHQDPQQMVAEPESPPWWQHPTMFDPSKSQTTFTKAQYFSNPSSNRKESVHDKTHGKITPPIFKYEPITDNQIKCAITNAVLTHCTDIPTPHLGCIYWATFNLNTFLQQWKMITTAVLWKPNKPSTPSPKLIGQSPSWKPLQNCFQAAFQNSSPIKPRSTICSQKPISVGAQEEVPQTHCTLQSSSYSFNGEKEM